MSENKLPVPATAQAVGYGRPPAQHRFQKGRSGNPGGRPRGARGGSGHPRPLGQAGC